MRGEIQSMQGWMHGGELLVTLGWTSEDFIAEIILLVLLVYTL